MSPGAVVPIACHDAMQAKPIDAGHRPHWFHNAYWSLLRIEAVVSRTLLPRDEAGIPSAAAQDVIGEESHAPPAPLPWLLALDRPLPVVGICQFTSH